jgi:hypothetical protein
MTSATWRQGDGDGRFMELDPSNAWLGRMAPRRLEFEPMRDSLLYVAARLDGRFGGRGELLDQFNNRRAAYGFTDRFRIPALLRNFDVANPDTSISRRAESLIPLQALFLMNSEFVRRQAEAVLRRPEFVAARTMRDKIAAVFRIVYARQPDDEESRLALGYLVNAPLDANHAPRWADFVQSLMFSNEFAFVD